MWAISHAKDREVRPHLPCFRPRQRILKSLSISKCLANGVLYFFANSVSIHHLWRKFTTNSLFISRIQIHFAIFFANSVSIRYRWRELTTNSLFFSRIHSQFTIYCPNFLRIYYLFRVFTINSLSISRIHILTLYDYMTHYYYTSLVIISKLI